MPVSWQTRLPFLSATETLVLIVSRMRLPTLCVSCPHRVLERVAEVLGDVLERPHVQVGGGVLDGGLQVGGGDGAHAAAARPARRPKTTQSSSELPIMRLRPCTPPVISPAAKRPSHRGLAVASDAQAAVLVVQHRVGQDRLAQGVDPRRAVAPQHGRDHDGRDLRVDRGGVQVHRRASVRRGQSAALLALAHDRLGDRVAGRELVAEALAGGVSQRGAVAAAGLGDREALQRRRPGAAGGMVLERVVVAHLGAQGAGEHGRLARGAGLVRREHAGGVGLGVAAAAGGEHDRGRIQAALVVAVAQRGAEMAVRALEADQSGVIVDGDPAAVELGPQRLRDRVPRAVAHLQETGDVGAAAAREPVAAAVARELDADRLEPARWRPAPPRSAPTQAPDRRCRGTRRARPRRDARASPRGRRRPGCRRGPCRCCTTPASPWSRAPRRRPRRRRPMRRPDRRRRCRSRARPHAREDRSQAASYPSRSNLKNKTGLYQPALPDRPGPSPDATAAPAGRPGSAG